MKEKIQRRHIYKLSGELMFTGIIQDLGTIKTKIGTLPNIYKS